jgi:hypothetical protein
MSQSVTLHKPPQGNDRAEVGDRHSGSNDSVESVIRAQSNLTSSAKHHIQQFCKLNRRLDQINLPFAEEKKALTHQKTALHSAVLENVERTFGVNSYVELVGDDGRSAFCSYVEKPRQVPLTGDLLRRVFDIDRDALAKLVEQQVSKQQRRGTKRKQPAASPTRSASSSESSTSSSTRSASASVSSSNGAAEEGQEALQEALPLYRVTGDQLTTALMGHLKKVRAVKKPVLSITSKAVARLPKSLKRHKVGNESAISEYVRRYIDLQKQVKEITAKAKGKTTPLQEKLKEHEPYVGEFMNAQHLTRKVVQFNIGKNLKQNGYIVMSGSKAKMKYTIALVRDTMRQSFAEVLQNRTLDIVTETDMLPSLLKNTFAHFQQRLKACNQEHASKADQKKVKWHRGRVMNNNQEAMR